MRRLPIRQAVYRLLTDDDESFAQAPPEPFRHAWAGLLIASLAWAGLTVGIWHGSYALFRDNQLSALLVGLALLGGPYRRGAVRLVELAARSQAGRSLAAAGLVVVFVVCLGRLEAEYYRQETPWVSWLMWLRPPSKIDRVLLLMPLWGLWGVLIPLQFHRVGPDDAPALAATARGCGPLIVSAMMGGLMAASIAYFSFLPWTQLTISIGTILVALVGGLWLSRRAGRLDRTVLLANGVLVQAAFLLLYLANRHIRIGWW